METKMSNRLYVKGDILEAVRRDSEIEVLRQHLATGVLQEQNYLVNIVYSPGLNSPQGTYGLMHISPLSDNLMWQQPENILHPEVVESDLFRRVGHVDLENRLSGRAPVGDILRIVPELKEFLTINQNSEDEIKRLSDIANKAKPRMWGFHNKVWLGDLLSEEEFFTPILTGSTLVDLGAGKYPSVREAIHSLLPFCIEHYIAVDMGFLYGKGSINELKREFRGEQGFPNGITLKNGCDMLEFLASLQDPVNVMINAVDGNLIPPSQKEYLDALRKQIARVVPKGGIAFGSCSPHLRGLEKLGFESIRELPYLEKYDELYVKK